MKIEMIKEGDSEPYNFILKNLIDFNTGFVGTSGKVDVTIVARNDEGQIVGGTNSFPHWNYFFIAHFWIEERHRGHGLGSKILKATEAEAIRRGCEFCYLDTFSWQAAEFYEKNGYKLFGELKEYPPGHSRKFYVKKLK